MQKVTANDGSSGDYFGYSVGLSGTRLVVGAPYDDDLGSNSGSVHVYSVTDSGATFVQKITANDGRIGDYFGWSIALSGTRLVVGAPYDDVDFNAERGAVYVYSVSDLGATFVQKVTANDGRSSDFFGYSVGLSGTRLVVGAYGDDGVGSVYVYNVSDSGATFVQKVTANDGSSGDSFGYSVALSGTRLVVGAPYDNGVLGSNSGSVYVYSVTDSAATLVQKITANDSSSDYFGWSIALSGTHLVVGEPNDDDLGSNSGSVHVYSVTDSGATLVQKVTANDGSSRDGFGDSVALSGTHLVVGAKGDDSWRGSVYVYSVTDSGATLVQKVTANDGSSRDFFGHSVALSGTHMVVGAYGDDDLGSTSGSVYLA
eukprot:gene31347-39402_t